MAVLAVLGTDYFGLSQQKQETLNKLFNKWNQYKNQYNYYL